MSDLPRIIDAYDSAVIRAYATVRFRILRLRFIEEIGQYLPADGDVLDIGCGFGLFAFAFAQDRPRLRIRGVDLDARRIETARRAAQRLALDNVRFEVGDARDPSFAGRFDAVYMLDIVHHIPPGAVAPLLRQIRAALRPGGVLLVKDVADRPAWKRWFTWALDKLVDRRAPVNYWSIAALRATLEEHGFRVHAHQMVDVLPYPHVLFICRAAAG
jgi:2-polyprenyl-3-methyl-5-hydroxy-6-metoxy-1,4-benzoquinol methylase